MCIRDSYDAVIIGHSQFERIPISPERQERLLHQQIEEITDGIQEDVYKRQKQERRKQDAKRKREQYWNLRK